MTDGSLTAPRGRPLHSRAPDASVDCRAEPHARQDPLAGVPHIPLQAVLDHPRFAEARDLYLREFLPLYEGDAFLARLLIESGRFLVSVVVMDLHAGQDPARRETWPTVGRLKQEMARFGLASGRQIDSIVGRLREVGFLRLLPAEADGRVRLLEPTSAMHAHDRAWLAANYAPLTLLCPGNDYGPILRREPGIHAARRRAGLALMPMVAHLFGTFPDILFFFNRAGGALIVSALIQAATMADPGDPHPAVPYADVGERFGVSRTQVRKLLVAAEQKGLVRLHGRGGRRVEILPRLWHSFDHGFAVGQYVHDLAYAIATGRAASAG